MEIGMEIHALFAHQLKSGVPQLNHVFAQLEIGMELLVYLVQQIRFGIQLNLLVVAQLVKIGMELPV